MENDIWTETICPYPGNHYWAFTDFAVDENNNLHCIGMYHDEGQSHEENRVIYFKYEYDNLWDDKTFLSFRTAWWYGQEIDVDNQNIPHVAYRRKDPFSIGNNDDSTMYRFDDGIKWTVPELVVSDPYGQCIAIDTYNRVNIMDWEKLETGFKIVHYQKINDLWQGNIIDETDFYLGLISLIKSNQKLFVAYYWSDEESEGQINFSSFDIITGTKDLENKKILNSLSIYPNPFNTQTTIEFTTNKVQHINLSIYNLNGKHIKTLMNENTVGGEYRLIWKGEGKNGKEDSVIPGLYLVRLQSGRKIVTKAVEYIK